MSEPNTIAAATGHEVSDASVRPLVLVAGSIAVMVALVFALSVGVFRYFTGQRVEAPANPMSSQAPQYPPAPRIQVEPAIEYEQLRAQEDRTLSTYGWVDRKNGTVRIPIDRAIDLQLQRGFPVRKEAPRQ